jgi:hypothetical protein
MRCLTRYSALSLLAAGLACSDSTGPNHSPVGTWRLQSINGQLPFSLNTGTTVISILGGALAMSANGSYNEMDSFTEAGSGGGSASGSIVGFGTYLVANGAVTFTDANDGVAFQGLVTGNTLTKIVNGMTEVYARQ